MFPSLFITGLIAMLKAKLFAERVGVEPTVQFDPYDDLANRSFRPLRHLSIILFKRFQDGKNSRSKITFTFLRKKTKLFFKTP